MCVPASAASASVGGAVIDFGLWAAQSVVGVLIEQGVEAAAETWWGTVLGEDFNAADFEEGGKYHPGGTFDEGIGASRAELAERYNQYVTDLQTDLGTTTLIDGGYRIYLTLDSMEYPLTYATSFVHIVMPVKGQKGLTWDAFYQNTLSNPISDPAWFKGIELPFTAQVRYGYLGSWCSSWTCHNLDWWTDGKLHVVNQGSSLSGMMNFSFYMTFDERMWVEVYPYADVYPVSSVLPTSVDITINSRPASIVGDYGIIGDDGTIIHVEGNMIVDESTNTVYNPVANTTNNYTDYAFDYSDRSYNLTLEDGSTMKVVYGDENVTIQEGDTVYNVYYLTSGSEGGSGGSGGSGDTGDDGSGGIGGAIGGLFDVLGEIIYSLIEGLINLATKALSALTGLLDLLKQFAESIIGFFGGYTDFLAAAFPFLPEETFTILNLGLILLIAAAVFKKFL